MVKKLNKIVGAAMGTLLTLSLCANTVPKAGTAGTPVSASTLNADGRISVKEAEAPTAPKSDEMAAYLFVHFIGGESNAKEEQIYFSVSKNGTSWNTLNDGEEPIVESNVGEKGVRDPHIIRSPQGDKFYMIATDLSIYNIGGDWGGSQTNGSQSIVIWESTDLVNWSEPRLRKIARDNATCTWAPESIYDEEREAYMVFWASKTKEDWTHRIYRCYTTDFDTFTEPEVYMESDVSLIDTTFIKEGDTYYRFTKNEARTFVYMEKSKSLSGDFEAVRTYTLNGESHTNYGGYEGPTVYKLNGENKWCLLLDNYGKSAGYKPFVTDDISKGRFTSASAFNFGGVRFRHGTVMPITQAEYDALVAAYPFTGSEPEEPETGELVYALDFEENLTPSTGTLAAVGSEGLEYGDGVNGGKAVKLTDNHFVSVTGAEGADSPLKGLTSFTVSFAAKASGQSWLFFAAANNNEQKWQSEKYIGLLAKDNGSLEAERYLSDNSARPAAAAGSYTKDEWTHYAIVYRSGSTSLYVNGVLAQKVNSKVNLSEMLGATPVIQLGRANWGANGEYSNALMDSFKIHNYALGEEEVTALHKSVMGIA